MRKVGRFGPAKRPMKKLNFTRARLLADEFRRHYAAFILKVQAGRLPATDQTYLCCGFGLLIERGLELEIELQPIADDCELAQTAIELPEDSYTGQHGTVPIRYVIR